MNPTILLEAGFATGEWSPQSLINLIEQQLGVELRRPEGGGPLRLDPASSLMRGDDDAYLLRDDGWEAEWDGQFPLSRDDEFAIVQVMLRWSPEDWVRSARPRDTQGVLELDIDVNATALAGVEDQQRMRDVAGRLKTLPRRLSALLKQQVGMVKLGSAVFHPDIQMYGFGPQMYLHMLFKFPSRRSSRR